MRAIFITLALLGIMGSACSTIKPQLSYNSPQLLKKMIGSVVRITTDYTVEDKVILAKVRTQMFATGFSIDTDGKVSYILTNQHVCSMHSAAIYTLTLQSGEKVKATFVRVDDFADICLLKTPYAILPLHLSQSNAGQGERVISIGNPDGVYPIVVEGQVSGYFNIHMKTDAEDDNQFDVNFRSQIMSTPIYPGASGSPVMNTKGEVVGIVFAVRGEKEHISFMVPISEVWRFIDTSEYVQMN